MIYAGASYFIDTNTSVINRGLPVYVYRVYSIIVERKNIVEK